MAKKEISLDKVVTIVDGTDNTFNQIQDATWEALNDGQIIVEVVKKGGYIFLYFGYYL